MYGVPLGSQVEFWCAWVRLVQVVNRRPCQVIYLLKGENYWVQGMICLGAIQVLLMLMLPIAIAVSQVCNDFKSIK